MSNTFTAEQKAATLGASYAVLAQEVSSLSKLAGGCEPEEELCAAISYIAKAMSYIAGVRAFCLCGEEICGTSLAGSPGDGPRS